MEACDIDFQKNLEFYAARYDYETALRLAFEAEERALDAVEREEEARASEEA